MLANGAFHSSVASRGVLARPHKIPFVALAVPPLCLNSFVTTVSANSVHDEPFQYSVSPPPGAGFPPATKILLTESPLPTPKVLPVDKAVLLVQLVPFHSSTKADFVGGVAE